MSILTVIDAILCLLLLAEFTMEEKQLRAKSALQNVA